MNKNRSQGIVQLPIHKFGHLTFQSSCKSMEAWNLIGRDEARKYFRMPIASCKSRKKNHIHESPTKIYVKPYNFKFLKPMKILLTNLKSSRGSFCGKFYNEPLRKSGKKGFKIVRASYKEGLESVR